jgi:hypothetical protein
MTSDPMQTGGSRCGQGKGESDSRGRFGRWIWILPGALLLLLVGVNRAWLAWICAREPVVSEQTTVLTGPIGPDGMVDYAAALNDEYGRGIEPERNLLAAMLRLVGSSLEPGPSEAYWRRLGVKPVEEPLLVWVDLGEFAASWPEDRLPRSYLKARERMAEADPLAVQEPQEWIWDVAQARWDVARKRAWSPEEFPILSDWLDANRDAMDQALRALRKEQYFNPVDPEAKTLYAGIVLPRVGRMLELSHALAARATRKDPSRPPAARAAELAPLLELNQKTGNAIWLIDSVVFSALADVGADALQAIVLDASLTEEQLTGLAEALPRVGPRADPAGILRNETLAALDHAMALRAGKVSAQILRIEDDLPVPSVDINQVLRMIVDDYHKLRDALEDPVLRERFATEEKSREQYAQRDSELLPRQYFMRSKLGKVLTWLVPAPMVHSWRMEVFLQRADLPSTGFLGRLEVLEDRGTKLRMVRAALAIRLHKIRTGRWPQGLRQVQELTRRDGGGAIDRESWTYRIESDGFLLHSPGRDSQEDGSPGPRYGDIVVRFPQPDMEPEDPGR